ncbi:MAG: hypothetical protein BAA01_02345 [Bacillus thermozeamaize]|jgi:hypothetical protein|uniref:Uncharacterized protein n=1 Tax=Bacillus thermozeamaize TaxID=230954 RepID=A0A1Y3PQJ0_9BACI|nr:MAG: hypothetical protein BAA01_02345 [Bacillus thermozeamaize]
MEGHERTSIDTALTGDPDHRSASKRWTQTLYPLEYPFLFECESLFDLMGGNYNVYFHQDVLRASLNVPLKKVK